MSSYGQELLASYLTALTGKTPEVDVYPKWLNGMELDLFYPEWDLAIEFQGQQHYVPTYGANALRKQQAIDKRKRHLCEANGILLVRFDLVDLRHPQATEVLMRAFSSAYGPVAGMQRFFKICGENPISRSALFNFNVRFDTHRNNQMAHYGPRQVPGNAKQRRRLKRAMHRR